MPVTHPLTTLRRACEQLIEQAKDQRYQIEVLTSRLDALKMDLNDTEAAVAEHQAAYKLLEKSE